MEAPLTYLFDYYLKFIGIFRRTSMKNASIEVSSDNVLYAYTVQFWGA